MGNCFCKCEYIPDIIEPTIERIMGLLDPYFIQDINKIITSYANKLAITKEPVIVNENELNVIVYY